MLQLLLQVSTSQLIPLPLSLILPLLPQLLSGREQQLQLPLQRPLQQLSSPLPISSRRPQQLPILPSLTWPLQRLLLPQLFLKPISLPIPSLITHSLHLLWLPRELFRQQSSLASPFLQFLRLLLPLLTPFVPLLQPPSFGVLSHQLPLLLSTQP